MIRAVVVVLMTGFFAGCVPAWPYSTMASHTLRAASDKDVDVVWVQDVKGKLYRCSSSAEGPVCVAVKL